MKTAGLMNSLATFGDSFNSSMFRKLKFSHLFIWAINAWSYLIVRLTPQTGADNIDIHTLYWFAAGATSLALALFYHFLKPKLSNKTEGSICIIALVFVVMGSIFVAISFSFSGFFTSLAGTLLCALGGSYITLRWLWFYSTLPIKTAFTYIVIAYLIMFLCLPLINLLPQTISVAIVLALPMLSAIMLRKSLKHAAGLNEKTAVVSNLYNPENIRGFTKFALGIIVYSILLGLRGGFPLSKTDILMDFVLAIVGLLFFIGLFCWVYLVKRSPSFSRILQAVFILLATAAVMYLVFPWFPNEVISGVFSATSSIIYALFFLVLIDISSHSTYRPMVICGVGLSLYGLPRPIGAAVAEWCKTLPGEQSLAILTMLLTYVIIICVAFFFSSKPHDMPPFFLELGSILHVKPLSPESLDARCDTLEKTFGLTQREIEVVRLIYKGRDKAYIAETLFISENTVRSYSKNAYRKLSVHSKRELLDLIDAM